MTGVNFYEINCILWLDACPALQCLKDRHAGVTTKVCPLLRQTSCFCACSVQTKPIRHRFLERGFPIPEENTNLTGVVFLYTLAVKLQASRLANQACQILAMGWLEQVIPGLPWNGQHGRLPWWFKASLMKDLIQCKHLADEYTESPMGKSTGWNCPATDSSVYAWQWQPY